MRSRWIIIALIAPLAISAVCLYLARQSLPSKSSTILGVVDGRKTRATSADNIDTGISQSRQAGDANEHSSEAGTSKMTDNDLAKRLKSSTDIFEFVAGISKNGYDGDGAAQYYISRALIQCDKPLSLVRNEQDPESKIWSLNVNAGWTFAVKERTVAQYRRCRRLLKEDPFAVLPKRVGGYPSNYWLDRAVKSSYPMAQVEQAFSDLARSDFARRFPERTSLKTVDGSVNPPAAEHVEDSRVQEAQSLILRAVSSKNPDALLYFGFRMASLAIEGQQDKASAWMLAACNMGADCSSANSVLPFSEMMCTDSNTMTPCDTTLTVTDAVQRGLGARFGAVYLVAQDIQYKLNNNDIDGIKPFLRFKSTSGTEK